MQSRRVVCIRRISWPQRRRSRLRLAAYGSARHVSGVVYSRHRILAVDHEEAEGVHHHVVSIRPIGARGHHAGAAQNHAADGTDGGFHASARPDAHGNSGVPIVGDPDHIAQQLIDLSRAA